jgi:hypothetical protein
VAIEFTLAPTVATGDRITSTQFSRLADAFNQRLVSGLGDGPWRVYFYWLSMFRQVRNPDETGTAFPPNDEFFQIYQLINPTESEWPVTGPGDPEGANVASQMNAFVFGAEAANLDEESDRLPEWLVATDPMPSQAEIWEAAKSQRGGYDPDSGGIASPSYDSAREHWKIRYSRTSPHGNSYGGFLPEPEVSGTGCEDPDIDDGVPAPRNYIIKFTSLIDGTVVSYPGTCQPNPDGSSYDDHVAFVATLPWAYYVVLNDGSIDLYPFREWIEGPYTGEGVLQKRENGAIGRMLNNFVREFRGTDAERASNRYHLDNAFDFHRFFTSQYRLAPNIGIETEDLISVIYPRVTVSSGADAGEFLPFVAEGDAHEYRPGFVLNSFYAGAAGLAGPVTFELMDGEDVIRTVTLTPDSSGAVSQIFFMDEDSTPAPLRVRLATALAFLGTGGELTLEFTELVQYKPQVNDAYVLIRSASALGSTPDGIGPNETEAFAISDDYFEHGCFLNRNGVGSANPADNSVSTNAVWDAVRRFSKVVRIARRQEFVKYAVEDGKSVLWFRRFAFGLHGTTPADVWDGIGPRQSRVSSSEVTTGITYVVREGEITYNGDNYVEGQTFVGVAGQSSYTGDGELFEYEGIRATAPVNGYSNEWVLGVEFKAYHPSESSIWKPSAYSDYWGLMNRCHFYSPDIANDPSTLMHGSFGERAGTAGILLAEFPPGYNYVSLENSWLGSGNANTINCDPMDSACIAARLNFYKSCRIYEPDVQIESVVAEINDSGEELVKVTMTGRLHHCSEDAPSSIDGDISTWNLTELAAESYRTTENGLREYLVNQTYGNQCSKNYGNWAATSGVDSLPDNPYGSCYPTFRLCKLIPKPYEDGNDSQNGVDTRFEHDAFAQMELYLRAMCEGWVDGKTSAAYACESGTISVFDFTFETLCFGAFGGRWIGFMDSEDRDDNPQGYGPLPNTYAKAELFNQFSSAINLLTTVRVMVPSILECATPTTTVNAAVQMMNSDMTSATCSGPSSNEAVFQDRLPEDPAVDFSTLTWGACPGGVEISASSQPTGDCSGSQHEVETAKMGAKFRWALSDSDAQYAIPESWRADFTDNSSILASIVKRKAWLTRGYTTDVGEAEPCVGHTFPVGDGRYVLFTQVTDEFTECQILSGEIELPALEYSSVFRSLIPGSPDDECPGGPVNRWTINALSADVPTVTFPLVDPDAEEEEA